MIQTVVNGMRVKETGEHIETTDNWNFDRYKVYSEIRKAINKIKKEHPRIYKRLRRGADKLKTLQLRYRKIMLPINKAVCRVCDECCCRNKVGYLRTEDYVYYEILNEELPDVNLDKDTKGCMFLDKEKGCVIKAYLRPYVCITAYSDCRRFNEYDGYDGKVEKQLRSLKWKMEDIYVKLENTVRYHSNCYGKGFTWVKNKRQVKEHLKLL